MNERTSRQEPAIDWRWRAVETRNHEFDGVFYFGVQTTGIFCRPSCSSRSPKQRNVSFFETPIEAENAGFRACLRCKPKNEYFASPGAALIVKALELLKADEMEIPTIDELSKNLNVSAGHLAKTFKAFLGLSPKEVFDMMRIENFKQNVKAADVTTSLYESGFGSSRSLYEKAGETLGMTPAIYKKGGKNMKINYTIVDSMLGKLMVAATEKGICSVSFGDDTDELKSELNEMLEKTLGFKPPPNSLFINLLAIRKIAAKLKNNDCVQYLNFDFFKKHNIKINQDWIRDRKIIIMTKLEHFENRLESCLEHLKPQPLISLFFLKLKNAFLFCFEPN